MKTNPDLESYREQREVFLAGVVESLVKDSRFVAAWLTGSISRNEADSLSDIDLSLVVSDLNSPGLCTRLEQVSAETSSERYALFSQFGTPALIHENNNNAPNGGTFTFVMYSDSAIMTDWILIPQSTAQRPYSSRLLFDTVGIPVLSAPSAESLEQRRKSVAEQWAFFWMMAAVTIKYIVRNDGVFAAQWMEHLHAMVREIERQLNGEPRMYVRGSLTQLQTTRESQLESIRQLCQKMSKLKQRLATFTGSDPLMPLDEIETLLSFVINESKSEV